jgi:DNA-binding transcriptional LysR family regulator
VASNSPEFLKAMAMHGAGIIRVAEFLVRDDIASGRLPRTGRINVPQLRAG